MKDRKDKLMEDIGRLRLRPVDIEYLTGGYISQGEAGRWLKGKLSKGAVLALEHICTDVQSQWEAWQKGSMIADGMAEIIVRANRAVEKTGGKSASTKEAAIRSDELLTMPKRVDIVWDGNGGAKVVDNPIGKYMMTCDPYKEDGSVGGGTTIICDMPDHTEEFTDIFGTPSKERCLPLNHAEQDVDGVMEMCYAVKGINYNFGDGEDIYWCRKPDLIGVTHVSMGGMKYPVTKFGKK